MLKLYHELKRRNVFKTIGVYGAAAIVITTTAASLFPFLYFPEWTVRLVIILAILGFPITFFLSWTYDLKPEPEMDDNTGHGEVGVDKKSRTILLPLTGFLTIVGVVFWVWYSLGNVSVGSGLNAQIGIKKSIAVLSFDNLTGQKWGDHFCSGISEHIRSVLTEIGKLDVKSRLKILDNNPKDSDLDYYIDGTLSEIGGRRNINVTIVNAKSESNLWTGRFEFNDEEIFAYQDKIIQSLLINLDIAPIENQLTSSAEAYKNLEAFELMGEGVYHFENKNYSAAMDAFNSVLESDPENLIANFHKANTYSNLNKYDDAMTIYKDILSRSNDIHPIDMRWSLPERKNIFPTLCTNIELTEEKDFAIMLLKGNKSSLLFGYNLESKNIEWEEPIDDQFASNPVIINNTVFLTSNRVKKEQGGQPTLYAYDISTGGRVLIKEFPRDNENQAVILNVLERYSKISDNNSTILLSINKLDPAGDSREIALIETTSNSVLWQSKIDVGWGSTTDFMLVKEDSAELLLLILRHDIIALNTKDGKEEWREKFSSSRLVIWNQKILQLNVEKKYMALWDPVSKEEIWKYSDVRKPVFPVEGEDFIFEFKRRMNKDVILINYADGNLVAVNYKGGFLNWNRVRWTRNIGIADKIWIHENVFNRVFCLTQDDTLFTINMADGKIINRFPIDRHDYNIYFDDSQNATVLKNTEFLIGVDPINGDQLWKIKDMSPNKAKLVGNSVLTKKVLEDSLLLINNYNRDNGNLIWSENINISKSFSSLQKVYPICSGSVCDFCGDFIAYLEEFSNDGMLLVLHDEIINIDAIQSTSNAIRQNEVHLQIARTNEKNRQMDRAIKEYNLLINKDQMNQYAHWELANIYLKKNNADKAIKSLINYYELVLPTSAEGIKTIQKLKNISDLKWEKNVYWDGFNHAEIRSDNDMLYLFLDNNISAYRINSGAQIWRGSIGNSSSSIIFADVKNKKNIFLIQKDGPDVNQFYLKDRISGIKLDFEAFKKASKYSLAIINKKDGNILRDMPLDIAGESDVAWMGAIGNKIIIQSIIKNKMYVSAYDIGGMRLLWETSYDISTLYTSYDLTPAFYNSNLLLPLDDRIEYINFESGNSSGAYLDAGIDHIFSFNENSIQNNTMRFFIDEFDYEYVVVDLDKNMPITHGFLDVENPERGLWINNIFVDVSSSGTVTVYELPLGEENEVAILWQENYNASLNLLGAEKQYVYLLDKENNYIYEVSAQSGKEIKKTPILWPGENVEMTNHYFIIQSANKLSVFPI